MPSIVDSKLKIQGLENWFTENQITYDKDKLIINVAPDHSIFINALQDLELDQTVCRIPKEAVLSVRNCGIADIMEENLISGIFGLTFALVFEQSKGELSPWFGYIQSLPPRVNVPMLWTPESLQMLQGTFLHETLEWDRKALVQDYNEYVVPLFQKHPDVLNASELTVEKFVDAYSIVTSRAFMVDAYLGNCLVPFADIFNHKTDGEHVHFEADSDVCEFCGKAYGTCGCEVSFDSDSEGDEWESESNNSKEESIDESIDELEDIDHESIEDEDNIMVMSVVRPCKRGQEVFNTYGCLPNTDLLNLYGFCEKDNAYMVRKISASTIAQVASTSSVIDSTSLEHRLALLKEDAFQDSIGALLSELQKEFLESNNLSMSCDGTCHHEHHGEDHEDHGEHHEEVSVDFETFEIPESGEPPFELLVFMIILFAPPKLFKRWHKSPSSAIDYIRRITTEGDWSDPLDKLKQLDTKFKHQVIGVGLVSLFRYLLTRYETSFEETCKLLESRGKVNDETYFVLVLRHEEQLILNNAIEWCSSTLIEE